MRTMPLALLLTFALPIFAQDVGHIDKEAGEKLFPKRPYSPYAGRNYPTRPLFGDTHLHTSFSMDGGAAGARLGPADAYRFAKGQEVTASSSQQVKLSRPLDFLVVADHSDGLGFFPLLLAGDPKIISDPLGRKWYELIQDGKGVEAALDIYFNMGKGTIPKGLLPVPGTPAFQDAWRKTIDAAEEANDPGRFTAFIGFEWTSGTGGNNLHRNVIFRDGASRAGMVEPFTAQKPLGSDNPRDLWKYMAAYEAKTGGKALAIAHNGNGSNGRMFPIIESFTGKKIDREYAENRRRWEPLYEVTQMKGTSEAHPFLSPNDEFASFEIWDKGNLDVSAAKKPEMLEFEYARSAFKTGLKLERTLGLNPYKFGLVGSTDAHTALATADEDNFFGKTSGSEPSSTRAEHPFLENPDTGIMIMGWETAASGYAAVWATENTREAIWDAMERRETYATTGPRMVVRFFGGWEFEAKDAQDRMPANVGYTKGVPMGGDIHTAPSGKAPTFLVAALKDPMGANLDRIQIVKGSLDAKGQTHQKIYEVVWSDAGTRKLDAKGKLPAVGDTVDVANATWTNTIGDPELIAVWKDPDFDAAQSAFYYARVLEIPTPRWTAYDAKFFQIHMPEEVPMKQQERAYTSPIWYTP
jgi:Protein of unknown function (DUF3604)